MDHSQLCDLGNLKSLSELWFFSTVKKNGFMNICRRHIGFPDHYQNELFGNNWIQNDLNIDFFSSISREQRESTLKSSFVSGSYFLFVLVFVPLIARQCHGVKRAQKSPHSITKTVNS